MNKSKSLKILIVLAVMFCAVPSWGQDKPSVDYKKLKARVSALAADSPGNSLAGVAIVDIETGKEIYVKNGDEPLNPASNAKIVTAACALKQLGPEFRFVTSLHGKRDGSIIRGPIYIKGHADPSLITADLWKMVHELRAAGVRRVEGGVVVDDSYFDDEILPYAYDQQPNEDAAFRAPVGAVSLNYNALGITIRPGVQGLKPARVVLEPPDYAIFVNDTVTMAQGAHNPKISSTKYEDRTRIRVWGQIPLGARPVTYYRRIDNPSLFAGYGLKGVLESSGIAVGGGVQTGTLPGGTPKLSEHLSAPLSSILWHAGKLSNNFVTETILKTMGAEAVDGPGTWSASLDAAAEILSKWGLSKDSYVYRNGSGLFDANRFSVRQMVKVLRGAYLDTTIRPEFLAQLATGGADGTIKSRYREKSAKRYVRAKTGTLADVSTLSGFVLSADGRFQVAFSIMVNKAPGFVSSARTYQEKIVTAIAEALNP